MRDPKAVETLAGWFELMHSVKRAVDSRKLKPEAGLEIVEECRDLLHTWEESKGCRTALHTMHDVMHSYLEDTNRRGN